jgi:3-oxoacyl-[acyl-carrier protein] reductase
MDIAHAAAFLASDEASMITGVALEVDGGRCI